MAIKRKQGAKVADDGSLDWMLEQGISGTTNYSGEPMSEANALLRGTSGYGVSGSYAWGEWSKISHTDPDIATVLEFISAPIRDADIAVEPVDDSEGAEAMAEFVRAQLLSAAPGWAEYATQVVKTALSEGFALHEVVLAQGQHDSLPGGRGFVLKRLAERLPVSVHPTAGWLEEDLEGGGRELAAIRQLGQTKVGGFSSEVILPAEKCLLHSWQRSGLNYRGLSAFRAVWYIARVREQLLKLIAVSSIREGAGIPVAQSAGDSTDVLTPAQQRKLARALQNLVGHEHASIVMPKGWTVDWIFSPGANKGHLVDTYNALGQLILRQLGAQQISLGTGATGSRSVGEVHDSVAAQYVQSIVSMMTDVLNGQADRKYTGLVRKLIDANWGPQRAYPRLTISLRKRKLGIQERIAGIASAVTAGVLTVRDGDEAAIREELGLPPHTSEAGDDSDTRPAGAVNGAQLQAVQALVVAVASGQIPRDTAIGVLDQLVGLSTEQAEAMLGSAGLTPPPSPPTPPQHDVKESAPAPTEAPEGEAEDEAEAPEAPEDVEASKHVHGPACGCIAMARTPWGGPQRMLSAAEQRVDFTRIDKGMTDAKTAFAEGVASIVEDMVNEATPAVIGAIDSLRPDDVADIELDTEDLEAFVSDWVDSVAGAGKADVLNEVGIKKFAAEAETEDEVDPDAARMAVLRAQKRSATKRIVDRISQRLTGAATEAVRTGAVEDIMKQVSEELADAASLEADAGLLVGRVYNVGRQEAADMVGATKAEYSAILDSNACEPCLQMDGRTFDIDSPAYESALPPNRDCEGRDRCRCIMVFIPGGGE